MLMALQYWSPVGHYDGKIRPGTSADNVAIRNFLSAWGSVDSRVSRLRICRKDNTFTIAIQEGAEGNGYLMDAPDAIIESRSTPICAVPPMCFGNMPLDGGIGVSASFPDATPGSVASGILNLVCRNGGRARIPAAPQWIANDCPRARHCGAFGERALVRTVSTNPPPARGAIALPLTF